MSKIDNLQEYEWIWDPDRSDGGVLVDDIDPGRMPEYRTGNRLDITLRFWPGRGGEGNDTGGTFGTSAGMLYGGQYGGTYGTFDGYEDHVTRYKSVRKYMDHAGQFTTTETYDGTVYVQDRTPSGASVSSVIVKLVPDNGSLPETPGLWIGIKGIRDDTTRFIDTEASMDISATVLARGPDYDTRTDLLNDIGV